jgi:hypothetical protein
VQLLRIGRALCRRRPGLYRNTGPGRIGNQGDFAAEISRLGTSENATSQGLYPGCRCRHISHPHVTDPNRLDVINGPLEQTNSRDATRTQISV